MHTLASPPQKMMPSLLSTWGAILVLFFGIGASLGLYSLGWSGSLHFDDEPNLIQLGAVFGEGRIAPLAALDFIFSGDAGPLGRSVALASFLVDGSGWPHDVRALLYTNSLLHSLNGLLLAGALLQLGRSSGWSHQRAAWIASITAVFWSLLPISVSASLMPVQRMTVLSSSFMLGGLWMYLWGRLQLSVRPKRGLVCMGLGLGLGTLLGVLTKEQAALLPVLILVLEWTWLPVVRPASLRLHSVWLCLRVLGLYLPTVVIMGYLLRAIAHADSFYAIRDFSLEERLWTQAVILWDYLRLGLLPRASAFGPFHDDYPVLGLSVLTISAAAAWLVALLGAWWWRRKTPLPLFALLWFLAAHLLESTSIPLELYFEHRNYLALVGPLFALVAGVWGWAEAQHSQRLVGGLLFLYGLLVASVLWQTTGLFGQPLVAAPIWHEEHPASTRAAQYLAQQQVHMNAMDAALRTLDRAAERHENSAALRLQGLQLGCIVEEPLSALQKRLVLAMQELAVAPRRFAIVPTLEKLKTLGETGACQEVLGREVITDLALAALRNPRISHAPQERSNLNVFLATLYMDARKLGGTMQHMEAALAAVPSLQNLQLATAILRSAGLHQEALDLLQKYPPIYPYNPWLQKRMHQEWLVLQSRVEQGQKKLNPDRNNDDS